MPLWKRLNLRQNWPLWAAGAALVTAIVYYGGLRAFFSDSYKAVIIYPLVVIQEPTVLVVTCLVMIIFLCVEIRALVVIKNTRFVWLIGLIFVVGIFSCRQATEISFYLILIALVALSLTATKRSVKAGLASLMMLPAIWFVLFLVVGWLLSDFEHLNTTKIDKQVYHLAQIVKNDLDYCTDYYFVVYKCDNLGLVCNPVYNTGDLYRCWSPTSLPENISLIVDPTDNALYVQIGDERTLISR